MECRENAWQTKNAETLASLYKELQYFWKMLERGWCGSAASQRSSPISTRERHEVEQSISFLGSMVHRIMHDHAECMYRVPSYVTYSLHDYFSSCQKVTFFAHLSRSFLNLQCDRLNSDSESKISKQSWRRARVYSPYSRDG